MMKSVKYKSLNERIYTATQKSDFMEEEVIGGDPIYAIDGNYVTEDTYVIVKKRVKEE